MAVAETTEGMVAGTVVIKTIATGTTVGSALETAAGSSQRVSINQFLKIIFFVK